MNKGIAFQPFMHAFLRLITPVSLPFIGVPAFFLFKAQNDLNGWTGLGLGFVATISISSILALFLVRRWGFFYYVTAFASTSFVGYNLGNIYAALCAGPVALIAAFIYYRLTKKTGDPAS